MWRVVSFRLWAVLVLLSATTAADRLITSDGRVLEILSADELEEGYRIFFAHGTIVCAKEHVTSIEIEGDMSRYVPRNDDERKKLERGYVRYRGKWLSKAAYENQLRRESKARRERTAELAAHAEFDDGWEQETRHFQIKSNTSPELLDHYATLLEAFFVLVDDVVGTDSNLVRRISKMEVFIHKSYEDFHRYYPDLPANVHGFFALGPPLGRSLHFYHDDLDPATSEQTALHECTHLLTSLIKTSYSTPIWLNEAVAEYYGTARIEQKGRKFLIEPGQPNIDRVLTVQQAIRDGDDLGLETLMMLEEASFDSDAYAHAWSFVYFLHEKSDRYAKGFRRALRKVYAAEATRVDIPDILVRNLGVKDPVKLAQEWKQFIEAIEIDTPEAQLQRGLRVVQELRSVDYQGAAKDLRSALDAGLEDPSLFWALGVIENEWGNFDAAEVHMQVAVELAPLDGTFRYLLGRAILRGEGKLEQVGELQIWVPTGPDERIERAREQFGLALDLAPENSFFREEYEEYLAGCELRD